VRVNDYLYVESDRAENWRERPVLNDDVGNEGERDTEAGQHGVTRRQTRYEQISHGVHASLGDLQRAWSVRAPCKYG